MGAKYSRVLRYLPKIIEKMKLLFISEYFPPKIMGGGEINLFLLAKALIKQGVEVTVLTSYHPGLKKYEVMEGIKVIRKLKTGQQPHGIINNLKRSFIFPNSVVKETRKLAKKYDLIHFIGTSIIAAPKIKHNLFATIESYPCLCPKGDRIFHGKKECKIRCSLSKFLACQFNSNEIGKMKNKFYLKYNPLFLLYVYSYHKKLNKSLKYCRLIAISKYLQKVLLQHQQPSKVLPNIIEMTKLPKQTNKIPKVVYLGALIRSKGPHLLLQAIKGLNCTCELYGEGNLKAQLLKTIKKHQLNATIHQPVPYKKVPNIYARADIVVFPSVWPEPFGRISIEAMAMGKPVIGNAIGSIRETIQGTGILTNSVSEMRKALKELIRQPKLRAQLGKAGEKTAQQYQGDKITSKLIEIYNENCHNCHLSRTENFRSGNK